MSKEEKGDISCIGLHHVKSPINVGSALRLAENFGAKFVAATGTRFKPCSTDTTSAFTSMPLFNPTDLCDLIPYSCIPVAVEITDDAESIVDFIHPSRAYYIFGAEDHTLGRKILSRCKHTIYIPTNNCMNLANTISIVLYDRLIKQGH